MNENFEKEFIEAPTCPKCKKVFSAGTKFCDEDGTMLVTHESLRSNSHNWKTSPQKQNFTTITWILLVLFVLAFGAFIFTWTQYSELDEAYYRLQNENIELQKRLNKTTKEVATTSTKRDWFGRLVVDDDPNGKYYCVTCRKHHNNPDNHRGCWNDESLRQFLSEAPGKAEYVSMEWCSKCSRNHYYHNKYD